MSTLEGGVSATHVKRGRKPGDTRAVVARPEARYFRLGAEGTIVAKAAAIEPQRRAARLGFGARRLAFGRVLSTHEELEQRLPKWKALAVFSSDVMSSVAYATEASMFTLLALGTVAFSYLMPISFLIVGLLFLVTFSYRQTIRAYPQGGGSYIVAHQNLGTIPGLVAAAALLTDYVLTVSVSVSAGVFNLASALPALQDITVPLIVVAILLVTAVNPPRIRRSGRSSRCRRHLWTVLLLLVAFGLQDGDGPAAEGHGASRPSRIRGEAISLAVPDAGVRRRLLRDDETEAISNGTPAFKPPEWKNAQTTMVTMAVVLGVVFLGISHLATVSGAVPSEHVSVLSQIGEAVFGQTAIYYVLMFSTMGILVLAAQTSFADFPRLASILAKDGFMPRRFAYRGERLAFNAGIVVLALTAILVVVAFRGRVEALIPLYAIGVFTAFTLSQAGMVRHWLGERGPGWRRSAIINGFGATATGIVAVVFAIAKFGLGAWIVIVIVPVMVAVMLFIRRAYRSAERDLFVRPESEITAPSRRQRVVVPLPDLRRDAIQAIKFGLTMSDDVVAVHVTDDPERAAELRLRFRRQVPGVELLVLESPYRELVQPLIRYLEMLAARDPDTVTIVLVPERIIRHWWERLLFNQNAHRIVTR